MVMLQSDSTQWGIYLVLPEDWDMRWARQNGWEGKGMMLKMIVCSFRLCLSVCLPIPCEGEKPLQFSQGWNRQATGNRSPLKEDIHKSSYKAKGFYFQHSPSTAIGSCRGNWSLLPRDSQLDGMSHWALAKAGKEKLALVAYPKELVPGSVVSVINMSSYIMRDRKLITYKRSWAHKTDIQLMFFLYYFICRIGQCSIVTIFYYSDNLQIIVVIRKLYKRMLKSFRLGGK